MCGPVRWYVLSPGGCPFFFLQCSRPLESISTSALSCQRHTATDRTDTNGHIKTWPPVTLLVFTCDVASSCYCMFSTFYKCTYKCVSMRACVRVCVCVCMYAHVGAICPFPQIQLHISSRKQRNRAKRLTVTHCTLQSAHMPFTQALSYRRKQDTYQWGIWFKKTEKKKM